MPRVGMGAVSAMGPGLKAEFVDQDAVLGEETQTPRGRWPLRQQGSPETADVVLASGAQRMAEPLAPRGQKTGLPLACQETSPAPQGRAASSLFELSCQAVERNRSFQKS